MTSFTETFKEPCDAYYKIFTDQKDQAYKYKQLSPFEFKNNLIRAATKGVGATKVLNAGRGNPNFLATMPRYAFSLLVHICTVIAEEDGTEPGLGIIPFQRGIADRFDKLLNAAKGLPEGKFLKEGIKKMRVISGMGRDPFMYDLIISTLGCYYPDPSRIQKFAEPVLAEFMDKTVYRPTKHLKGKVSIFPTEGASAAIIYIFNSLKYNGLVVEGDKIGILTPIFSPYLEFPTLQNYDLVQLCIQADEKNNWEIPDSELEKIGDSGMKALFIVNPTNPSSMSLSNRVTKKVAQIVKKSNPNLIIIGDNVYAPFVGEFNSFFNVLPRNTIGVYSFSKYFGVTGWRLGSIIMHNNNIIDSRLLKDAPDSVNDRYKMVSLRPQSIKFIDRLLIDSREVAEAHTAGLGTPMQTFMCICAVHDMLDTGREYNDRLKALLLERMNELLGPLDYKIDETGLNSNYYVIIDICTAANNLVGGQDFGDYIYKHRDPLEFLLKLARNYGIVLLPAVGFGGPFWGVRVSLANLATEDYSKIGIGLRNLIDDYYIKYKKWEKTNDHRALN